MKRKCKHVDISDLNLIRQAVHECLKPAKKRKRFDTVALFANVLHTTKTEARRVLMERGDEYEKGVELISVDLKDMISRGDLNLSKPKTKVRHDTCGNKDRNITVLNIRHLMLEHVAVLGLSELCKTIGEYQVSSIKGRGTALGYSMIKKWVTMARLRVGKTYAAKLDIRNFYGSVDRDCMMKWLRRRVANNKLLWLVHELVSTIDRGIAIGSFLSQTLANIYLSSLYHRAKENFFTVRRGKRVNTFRHCMFYMDDMLLIGTNRREMVSGIADLISYAASELKLVIKPNWCIHSLAKCPINMVGYRFFLDGCIRPRRGILKRSRRLTIRARRSISKRAVVPVTIARRLASYYGYLTKASGGCIIQRVEAVLRKSFNIISQYATRSLYRQAAACSC